jgi:hypothetical protein
VSRVATVQLQVTGQDEQRLAQARPVLSKTSLVLLVALLLGETTINYVDRQVVSVLAPTLRAEFSLSNAQYALIYRTDS